MELKETAAPALESVVADNLKQVEVKFNTEISKDSISATTLKVYEGKNVSPTTVDTDLTDADGFGSGTVTYTLSSDKKTIIVTFETANAQDETIKVVVDGVETVDGDKITGTLSTSVLDTTLPTVKDVKVESSKKFYVYFSEPVNLTGSGSVKVWSDFVIDGTEFAGKVTQDDINSRLIFEPATNLTSGTKTIEISGVKDYASLPMVKTSKKFNVLVDSAAPTLAKVVATSYDQLKLEFDEELDAIGTVKLGTTDVTAYTKPDADDSKILVVDLSSATGANKEFSTSALVEENSVTVKDQADAEGNKTPETTVKFTVEDDTTAPTASATVNSDNEVIIKFSERVDATAATTIGNYTVKDADGNTVTASISGVYNAKTNSVKLLINGYNNTDGATYSVAIAKDVITDTSVRQNKMAAQNLSVTLKDNKKPTVSKVYLTDSGKSLTIIFSENMDTTTLANKSNYVFKDDDISTNTNVNDLKNSVVTVKDSKTVVITLGKYTTGGADIVATTSDSVAFQNMKDANGNAIGYNETATVETNAFDHTSVKSVEATGTKTLKVTLNSGVKFSQVAAKDFVIASADTGTALNDDGMIVTDAKLSTDGTYVTLTLSEALTTDGKFADYTDNTKASRGSAAAIYLLTTDGTTRGNAATATKNEIGTPLTIDTSNHGIAVQDKIAASVKSVEAVYTGAPGANTTPDLIKVTFDEALATADRANFEALRYLLKVAVDGTELSFVKGEFDIVTDTSNTAISGALAADNFYIQIKKDGVKSNNVTVALADTSTLTDANGNAVNAISATKVAFSDTNYTSANKYIIEQTAPTIASVAKTEVSADKKTVKLTFSEALDATTVISGAFTGTANGNKTSVTLGTDKKTVTIVYDNAIGDNETVIVGTGIKDTQGNALAGAITLTYDDATVAFDNISKN